MNRYLNINFLSKFYIDHFFAFFVFAGLVSMLFSISNPGVRFWELAVLVAIPAIGSLKLKPVDLLVLCYILYCLLTFLWGDISFDVFINGGVKCQLLPISFYFIARNSRYSDNAMLYNMSFPLTFAFTSALYLYFAMPTWYLDYKTKDLEIGISSQSWYENTRLSGFWGWSYVLGYVALFYIMFEMKRRYIDQKYTKLFGMQMIIAFFVLFFAQQRVSIAYCCVYLIFLLFINSQKKSAFIKILFLSLLGLGVIVGMIYYVIFNYMNLQFIEYILNRSVNHDSNLVEERFLLFEKYFRSISLFGSGIGKYSHYVFSVLNQDTISDCDYIRLLNEVGIIGFYILAIIITIVLIMGKKHLKTNFYEINVVLFLLVSMIGAAPLEAWTLHPYMYWYCMGRIVYNNYIVPNGKLQKY